MYTRLILIFFKVELSNHLSKKELIVAKKKFLSYDKEKMKMITKEDAKSCYMEYIKKIKEKLGAPMEDHISNCAELFGLRQNPEAQARYIVLAIVNVQLN